MPDVPPALARARGVRVSSLRDQPLCPSGRGELTLFQAEEGSPRRHPRLRITLPPAVDAGRYEPLAPPLPERPIDVEAWVALAVESNLPAIEAIDTAAVPQGGLCFARNSIRGQRLGRLFATLAAALAGASAAWSADDQQACRYTLRVAEDLAHARSFRLDDEDTGTYHSFGHDAPFVHHLEQMLDALPAPDSAALAALAPELQAAILRQRAQCQAHLDHLMRHKYAYDGVHETDIERSVGGRLIDRASRAVVSETLASQGSLRPQYERLFIAPEADHPRAGAALVRDGAHLRDAEGAHIEIDEGLVRSIAVEARDLTFARAPNSPLLRPAVRFDWNGDGHVQLGPISWVEWAGHCDIKGVLEAAGLALRGHPTVTEHRTDTGRTHTYGRDLLLEMLASLIELGSQYRRPGVDGLLPLGVHRFGGARNDSRPDRLQFQGTRPGRSLRWPLAARQDSWTVVALEDAGGPVDLQTCFQRYLPIDNDCDFINNPRFLKTVEGDYNLISVAGCLLTVDSLDETFDPQTGYPITQRQRYEIDLRPLPNQRRSALGCAIRDASRREQYRAFYDADQAAVIVEVWRFERKEGGHFPVQLPDQTLRFPLQQPLQATLSREQRLDDPSALLPLLDLALRQGQGICVDTDDTAAVWNGALLGGRLRRVFAAPDRRVERWEAELEARFGAAALRYLLRRDPAGAVIATCPLPSASSPGPDFLWQDLPDVGAKALVNGSWAVNAAMLDRGVITLRQDPDAQGGFYVADDHIKHLSELIWCGLAGHSWTLVHDNERYTFPDEGAWKEAIIALKSAQEALTTPIPGS